MPLVTGATGFGEPRPVDRFLEKGVQFSGTFTATFQVQGTIDGSTYFNIGSAATSAGFVEVPYTIEYLRISTVAWTSGTPTATFAGMDSRTDL